MTYPADYADYLCSIVERAKRGKAHKTQAYKQAIGKLLHNHDVEGQDAYAVFTALTGCAWAEGADPDYLEYSEMQAKHYLLGKGAEK